MYLSIPYLILPIISDECRDKLARNPPGKLEPNAGVHLPTGGASQNRPNHGLLNLFQLCILYDPNVKYIQRLSRYFTLIGINRYRIGLLIQSMKLHTLLSTHSIISMSWPGML